MKSDFVKKGTERAPHRSLFNAAGYTEKVLKEGYRTTDIMSEGKTLVGTREMGDLIVSHL